ncbi:MAG: ATP-binding protein [Chitinophagaceae bacterium]
MRNFYQQVVKKNVFFFLGAAWLFTIAFIIDNYWYSSSSAKYLRKNIEADMQQQEKDFDALLTDTSLLGRLVEQRYSADELYALTEKKTYCIFLYSDEDTASRDLKFWNTQLILPGASLFADSAAINELVKLSNGQYECIRRKVTISNNRKLLALALLPVHREYYLEFPNLKREFINYPQAEKSVGISSLQTDYPIQSITGKTLFYLQAKFVTEKDDTNWVTLTLNIVAILLLLIIVNNTAHYFSVTYGYLTGTFFLIGMVLFLRGLSYFFPSLLNLRQYELFDPSIYSSNLILNSLGDLLINSFLFCWMVLFVRREVGEKRFSLSAKKSWYWAALIFPVLILVVTTFVFSSIIKSLIADSRISFNVTNFFSLTNINSLGGFIVLATLSLSFFFLSQVILQLISPLLKTSKYVLFILIAIIGLVMLTIIRSYSFVELNIYVLLWLLAYVWFMQQHIIAGSDFRLAISEVLVWLFIFSFSISAIVVIENQRIELQQRKLTAEKLSNQADPASERLLSIALTYFDNDFLFASFDRFRVQASNHSLKDSLINKNFTAYLDKYDTRIYTFDSSENHRPLFNDEDPVSYDSLDIIFRIEGRPTNVRDLRYFSKSFDKFSYLLKKAVKDTGLNTVGYFFVRAIPKRYKNDALIPELFKPQQEYLPEYSPTMFAVYRGGRLFNYYNEYQFPTILSPGQIPKLEYEQRKQNGYDELWYKNTDKVVVIVRKDNYIMEGMTLFAYLFSTFLLLLAVFRVFSVLIQTRLRWHLLKQIFQVNLRSQIHGTFIFITLISIFVISVATIFFFISRYKRNNIERLSKAIQIMNNQVQAEIEKGEIFDDLVKFYESQTNDYLETMVRRVAEIHGTDINFYDLQGNLIVSSNLIVYSKGILSKKISPQAFYNLHNKSYIQFISDEQMGKVSYQSIYSPVRDAAGNAYAYLNIPSFDSQTELKREISNFLVTIINLNAFIFLIAGAIALFITNRITSSFTLISNKMRAVNLGKTNEEIPWHRNDEIGGLVTEYNKMVNKLEASAAQLAKSEREGAWREMARQVAHEIKNPLTPMKLSIQYLQKAIDNNSPNVKEMTSNVAKTLVEQIDHLSKIAADFSQFANIGNPKSEVFDIHEMLHSLVSLYMATENLEFQWYPVPQRVILFADKTQLNRLFTNLLQNAVEASENKAYKKIVMSEELEEGYIVIKISDNGDGIPLQVQEKIFTPNFTTKTSGTGLGLAMSRNIIEQAKGELWFETKEKEGSVFFVRIPLFRVSA